MESKLRLVITLVKKEYRPYLFFLLMGLTNQFKLLPLIQAIRMVAAGDVYLDPAIAGKVVGSLLGKSLVVRDPAAAELSERETDVVKLIAQGYSNKEIATLLNLSVKTVETYKTRAMEKIGLDSRVAIVRYALQRGWLQEL